MRSAEQLVNKYKKKVGIIVNDIGEVGIDDKVISAYGLKVKELFGGCVCCQLGDDLVKTIRTVQRRYEPDITILEASGAADPSQLLGAVTMAKGFPLETLPLLVLVDATRFEILMREMPVLMRKVSYAEVILINKIDAVPRRSLKRVDDAVRRINGKAEVRQISASEGRNIDGALRALTGLNGVRS